MEYCHDPFLEVLVEAHPGVCQLVPGRLSPGGPGGLQCGQMGLEFESSSDPLGEGAQIDCD